MKAIKWIVGIVVGLIVLVIALLLIVPQFIDIQKYKPEIEKQAEQATGRPFSIGGDLRLSLFPWAVIGLSDVHLKILPGTGKRIFSTSNPLMWRLSCFL